MNMGQFLLSLGMKAAYDKPPATLHHKKWGADHRLVFA